MFDGTQPEPYVEWDPPNPASMYGRSKLGGELELEPEYAVVRTSWVCGCHGANMVKTILRLAGERRTRYASSTTSAAIPTFADDLAAMLRRFVVERLPGTCPRDQPGGGQLVRVRGRGARAAGDDPARVRPIATAELDPPRPAPRPANSVLDNAALRLAGRPLLPDFRESLPELVRALG